jgi:hypothetical protein
MKPRKTVNPVRKYAVGSVVTALLLLSPIVALLMVSAAEMLIDVLIAGGASAVCAVAAGSFGLVLVRKFWRRPAECFKLSWSQYPEKRPLPARQCDAARGRFCPSAVMQESADAVSGLGSRAAQTQRQPRVPIPP